MGKIFNRNKEAIFITSILLVLVLLFFWKIAFLNKILMVDRSSYSLVDSWDELEEFFPWRYYTKQMINNGILPLWNPYAYSGMPFIANNLSGVFYPLSLTFYIFPVEKAFGYYAIMHTFLAGLFMYVFLRLLKIGKTGSLLGAIIFMFNGTAISKFPDPATHAASIWLPLLLIFIEKFFQTQKHRYIFWCSLVLGVDCLAGNLQDTFNQVVLLSFYFCFRAFLVYREQKKIKIIFSYFAYLVLILVTGVLLGAVQILPTYELVKLTDRFFSYGQAMSYSLDFLYLTRFFIPPLFSDPNSAAVLNTLGCEGYTSLLSLVLVFAAVCYRKRREVYFFAVAALFFLLASFKTPLYRLFYALPPARYLNSGSFMLDIYVFSIAVLSGIGFEHFFARKKFTIIFPLVIFLDLFFLGSTILMNPVHLSEPGNYFNNTNALKFLQSDKGIYRIIRFNSKPRIFPPNTAMVFGISDAQGFDSFAIARYGEFMNLIEPGLYVKDPEDFRIMMIRNEKSLESNLIDLINIKYILTTEQFANPKYQKVYDSYDSIYKKNIKIYRNKNVLPRAFIVFGQRLIADNREIKEYLVSKDFNPLKEVVLGSCLKEDIIEDGKGSSLEYVVPDIVKYRPNEVVIEADIGRSGWLLLSDNYYPGWHAYVDGRKERIYRANLSFRAVRLAKGKHSVRFIYSPFSFKTGLFITITTFLLLIFCLIKTIIKR